MLGWRIKNIGTLSYEGAMYITKPTSRRRVARKPQTIQAKRSYLIALSGTMVNVYKKHFNLQTSGELEFRSLSDRVFEVLAHSEPCPEGTVERFWVRKIKWITRSGTIMVNE